MPRARFEIQPLTAREIVNTLREPSIEKHILAQAREIGIDPKNAYHALAALHVEGGWSREELVKAMQKMAVQPHQRTYRDAIVPVRDLKGLKASATEYVREQWQHLSPYIRNLNLQKSRRDFLKRRKDVGPFPDESKD